MNNEDPKFPSLLQKFTMSLASKLCNIKVSIDETRGTATLRGKKDGKIFSFSIAQQDETEVPKINDSNKIIRKSDHKDEVKRLYKLGIKQTEIARQLNISQSLVSRLLKDNR